MGDDDDGRVWCTGVPDCDHALELMGAAEGAGCADALVFPLRKGKRKFDGELSACRKCPRPFLGESTSAASHGLDSAAALHGGRVLSLAENDGVAEAFPVELLPWKMVTGLLES